MNTNVSIVKLGTLYFTKTGRIKWAFMSVTRLVTFSLSNTVFTSVHWTLNEGFIRRNFLLLDFNNDKLYTFLLLRSWTIF